MLDISAWAWQYIEERTLSQMWGLMTDMIQDFDRQSSQTRPTIRQRLSNSFRIRRAVILRQLIDDLSQSGRTLKILDMGGRVQYWDQIGRNFLKQRNVNVTILNLFSSEMPANDDSGIFKFAIGNACKLDFTDNHFDLAHSNSVIEHVETWKNMKAFAGETRRVAKSYYVQTPYFWFPIDPHYYAFPMYHWLPRPVRARLLGNFSLAATGRITDIDKSFETVDAARLMDQRQFRFCFPDAAVQFERFLGLPKSLIAIRR